MSDIYLKKGEINRNMFALIILIIALIKKKTLICQMSGFAISKLAIMDFHRLLECESIHKSLIESDPETRQWPTTLQQISRTIAQKVKMKSWPRISKSSEINPLENEPMSRTWSRQYMEDCSFSQFSERRNWQIVHQGHLEDWQETYLPRSYFSQRKAHQLLKIKT